MGKYGNIKFFIFTAAFLCLFLANSSVKAVNFADNIVFYIDKDFDSAARTQITATLVKTTPKLYFYIEKDWWDSQPAPKQQEISAKLDNLSQEFETKIYPILTSVFGSEWNPGVDGDSKITVLFHQMKEDAGGYFRSNDEYIKIQISDSNEREMFYLSVSEIDSTRAKLLLAHEFVHLITFNQKNKAFGVEDEAWLNESRAEYSATMLGYNNSYEGSNLQKRVQAFLEKPSDSLTEWQNTKYDYGVINLFTHYLMDHYGINILVDSLKSKLAGIPSLNYALQKNGAEEDFAQIFTDWTITMAVNNCSFGPKYCFLNEKLNNIRINPTLNFLPLVGDSSLSVTDVTKNWSGNWQKFIGGSGDLKLNFSSLSGLDFKVPYLVYDKMGKYSLKFLALDDKERGEISIPDFGAAYSALIIIPSLQSKLSEFDGKEFTYPFTFALYVTKKTSSEEQTLIQQLLDQIDYLKKEIAKLQARGQSGNNPPVCASLQNNLYFGMAKSNDVKCLQQFLKNQGANIYPEGLVTGNFGSLTKAAVIKFQEKYASEILSPFGLSKGTGYVGSLTRQKINQLLGA